MLNTALKPYLRDDDVTALVETPTNRQEWITRALAATKIGVLLVTPDFLAVDVIYQRELLYLLQAAKEEKVQVIPVAVRDSSWKEIGWLNELQWANDPAKPLASMSPHEIDLELVRICQLISKLLHLEGAPPSHTKAVPVALPTTPDSPQAQHTFICYAREDEKFALKLATDLKAGGTDVWLDQWDIPSGADWDYEIDKALYNCRHFLIILSPTAVESSEVRSELRIALDESKHIVPILYLPCRIPRRLTLIQYIDFTSGVIDAETNLKPLLRALA